MIKLEHAFMGWKITDNKNTMGLWFNYFKGVPDPVFEQAVDEFITTSRYQPTVAGIMEIVTRYGEDKMLNASQAWNRVLRGVLSKDNRNIKEYAETFKLELDSPEVEALDRVGIRRIKNSMEKELPFLFNEFRAVYDKEKKRTARKEITQLALDNKQVRKQITD